MSGILITSDAQPDGTAVRLVFDPWTKHLVVERWETPAETLTNPSPAVTYIRARYRAIPVPVDDDVVADATLATHDYGAGAGDPWTTELLESRRWAVAIVHRLIGEADGRDELTDREMKIVDATSAFVALLDNEIHALTGTEKS